MAVSVEVYFIAKAACWRIERKRSRTGGDWATGPAKLASFDGKGCRQHSSYRTNNAPESEGLLARTTHINSLSNNDCSHYTYFTSIAVKGIVGIREMTRISFEHSVK